jgi:hypothetical protein
LGLTGLGRCGGGVGGGAFGSLLKLILPSEPRLVQVAPVHSH